MADCVSQVVRCLAEVFQNKGLEPPTLTASTGLTPELGLDSLDYAELVVRLEKAFGFDPFAKEVDVEIRTVADLASVYDRGAEVS